MLSVQNIHTFYGAVEALRGVTIDISKGELVCVIGANGAGKSTLLRSVVGITPANEGRITFEDMDISNLLTYKIARFGISLVPEGRQLFGDLSVIENLIMGSYVRSRAEMRQNFSFVFDLFPLLNERRRQKAGTLSGGEQQMLAIARALMSSPRLLLLDEPSLGLAPRLVIEIFHAIEQLNKTGLTILLVEQNANMALSVASRGYVMSNGLVHLEGSTGDLRENRDVRAAYFGSKSSN